MSVETTETKKTSFITDAWKAVNAKKNGETVEDSENTTPKRDAIVRFAKRAAVIGVVVATTAFVTLKVTATQSDENEISEDEEVNED